MGRLIRAIGALSLDLWGKRPAFYVEKIRLIERPLVSLRLLQPWTAENIADMMTAELQHLSASTDWGERYLVHLTLIEEFAF